MVIVKGAWVASSIRACAKKKTLWISWYLLWTRRKPRARWLSLFWWSSSLHPPAQPPPPAHHPVLLFLPSPHMKTLTQALGTSGIREGCKGGLSLGIREKGRRERGKRVWGGRLSCPKGWEVRQERGSQRKMCMQDSGGCCHRAEKGKWSS